MSHSPLLSPAEADSSDRHGRILDAAERCFVRTGFHRTTMQDVAAEAGMSPGNLYRYFRSKDAIVIAITERDRARIGEDFSAFEEGEDFLPFFRRMAQKYFADEPREKSVLCLEIWAEATRTRAFTEITQAFDGDINSRLASLFRQAQSSGAMAAGADPKALAYLVSVLADGLFVRRAIGSTFDPEREVGTIMAVIDAAFAGHIHLGAPSVSQPSPVDDFDA